MADGAAIAVADGVGDGVADEADDAIDSVAEDVAVADSIAVLVEFVGNNGDSGKKSATKGAMFEGKRMLEVGSA